MDEVLCIFKVTQLRQNKIPSQDKCPHCSKHKQHIATVTSPQSCVLYIMTTMNLWTKRNYLHSSIFAALRKHCKFCTFFMFYEFYCVVHTLMYVWMNKYIEHVAPAHNI